MMLNVQLLLSAQDITILKDGFFTSLSKNGILMYRDMVEKYCKWAARAFDRCAD